MIAAAGALLMLAADSTSAAADPIDSLLAAGSYREADSLAGVLLEAAERDPGPDSLRFTEAIERVLRVDAQQSRAGAQQVEQALRAVALRERAHGESDPRVAAALDLLGAMLSATGRWEDARSAAERALRILEAAGGEEHDGERARALSVLANVETSAGDPQRAIERWTEVHALRERASGPASAPAAQALHSLAIAYRRGGRSLDAMRTFRRALDIRESVLAADHPDVAWTLLGLANVYFDLGDFAEAQRLHRRALTIRESRLGPDHVQVALSLMNLANAMERGGDPAGAVPLHERALAIYESAYGPWHRSVAQVLNNLALARMELGELAAARPLFERSIAIRDSLLGPESEEGARTRLRLGHLLLRADLPGEAEGVLREAVGAYHKRLGPDHPFGQDATIALAGALVRLGEHDEALELALFAERATLAHLRNTAQGLDETQSLIYAASRSTGLEVALTLAAQAPEDTARVARTWDALARSRSVVLDEMVSRRHWAAATNDTAALRLHARVTAARDHLAHLALLGVDSGTPAESLAAAVAEKRAAEHAFAEHSLAFRHEMRSAGAGFSELAAAVPPGAALVTFAWYRDVAVSAAVDTVGSVLALALPPGGGPRAVPLGSAGRIDPVIQAWLAAIRRPPDALRRARDEEACEATGRALRALLWDPVAKVVGSVERVFVVPEGPLNVVPLAALPDGRGRTLAESEPLLCTLAGERDLLTAAGPERRGRGLLALGAPAFDRQAAEPNRGEAAAAADPCAVLADGRFEPLPGAAGEVADIAAIWDAAAGERATVLVGPAATERALRGSVAGRRALHVAAHGFFLPESCPIAPSVDGAPALAHPLLRGGLALTGANQRAAAESAEDDGILTAEEIAGLDLGSLEWVVLSACETGLGELDISEGVLGLRRALHAAGARSLVMSLWRVDDEATAEWMRALYRARFGEGLDAAAAARAATRDVLRQRRSEGRTTHPFFWAGFLVEGGLPER